MAKRQRHGLAGTAIYRLWATMVGRCHNPNNAMYPAYGAVGIKVCPQWRRFERFLADMGDRPSREHSLDRIDGKGMYEPGNVRWATRHEQQNNLKNNVWLTHDNKTMTIAQWERYLGWPENAVRSRLARNWSVARALTQSRTTKKKVPR